MKTSDGGEARLRPQLGLGAGALMLLPFLAGPAQATQLYDTTRVVQQQGNACLGEKDCMP